MTTQDGTVAVLQMNSGDDVDANLARAVALLQQAADAGAVLAALPENFAFMAARARDRLAVSEDDGRGPIQDFLAAAAQRLGLWIVAGTVPLRLADDAARVAPACLVYAANGDRVARYDKMHLFDVDVPASDGERYRESADFRAGPAAPGCVDTPLGRLGLSVCYDLRFPELYRRLVADGATLLCVPAAFTARTGRAHWRVLLRARAIENLAWVIAPAQCGTHPNGRQTWGHGLIVDPWGEVVAELGDDVAEAVATAPISAARQTQLRTAFPALEHRRL